MIRVELEMLGSLSASGVEMQAQDLVRFEIVVAQVMHVVRCQCAGRPSRRASPASSGLMSRCWGMPWFCSSMKNRSGRRSEVLLGDLFCGGQVVLSQGLGDLAAQAGMVQSSRSTLLQDRLIYPRLVIEASRYPMLVSLIRLR